MQRWTQPRQKFVILKEEGGQNYDIEFTTRSELLNEFKNHNLLCNRKVSGESASADTNATEDFLKTLRKMILEEKLLTAYVTRAVWELWAIPFSLGVKQGIQSKFV